MFTSSVKAKTDPKDMDIWRIRKRRKFGREEWKEEEREQMKKRREWMNEGSQSRKWMKKTEKRIPSNRQHVYDWNNH